MLKKSIIIFLLSILISLVLNLIFYPNNYHSLDYFLLLIILITLLIGIPNVLFILFVHYFKINTKILTNIKFLIAEIILLNLLYYLISKILLLVPYNYRFDISASYISLKPYFNPEFELLYTYIILFLFLIFIKKWTKRNLS